MNVLYNHLLYYLGLHQPQSRPAPPQEDSRKYKSITKYRELPHPPNKKYISTYKAKNYHYHFDQSINRMLE